MTKPTLPATGGSFARDDKGDLVRTAEPTAPPDAAQKPAPKAARKTPKKEA